MGRNFFTKCWSKDRLKSTSSTSSTQHRLEDRAASCSSPRVHQLWSYFYCIVLCLIQILLVYRAALTIEENMANPHLSTELYAYTVSVALSITISILAIVASVCRLGNFANDGDKLGKVIVRIAKNHQAPGDGQLSGSGNPSHASFWRRCWQRAAPFAPTCHLVAAYLLLIPRNFLLAKSLSLGQKPELATATEIDIFMRRKTTRLDLYLLLTLSSSPPFNSSIAQQVTPPSFVLGNERPSALTLPSAEWANYILSAVVFASRYPAVFWYTNKSIAAYFVIQQLLTVANYATSHAGFVLLFDLASMAKLVPFDFLLPPFAVFLLYIFSLVVILVSSMIIFEYGYEQYLKQIRTYQRLVRRSSGSSHQKLVVSANGHHNETDSGHESSALMMNTSNYSWKAYCSNIAAVLALICLTASKVPLVYDYMTVYRLSEDKLVFVCLVSDAVYFFYWIIIWFIFTLKQNWTFLIQHPFIYFRDVAIDSTDSNNNRSIIALGGGYPNQTASSADRNLPDSASAIVSSHNPPKRHYNMSRGSSPTRSLMDIAALSGPSNSGYGHHRLSRPVSALVNPQMAHGLSSPSLPNCKAGYGFDGNSQPTASSTLHIYRQSMREKNGSNFNRGCQVPHGYGVSNDPKRRSLQAKHFSALNSSTSSQNFRVSNGSSSHVFPIHENAHDRQSLNGWGLTSSGPATDIIPEDAPVDSFKPHIPLKLSTSSTCYQFDCNGRLSNGANGLHESRSDFLLMNAAVQGQHLTGTTTSATTASFASIPSIIKKRPAPPPRQSSANLDSNIQNNVPSSESPVEASTLTSSSASQV